MKNGTNMRCECNREKCSDKKYLNDILKSESEILKCLQVFLCHFLKDLEEIESPEKRGQIAKNIICAYECKEKSIAEVIKAISIKQKVDNYQKDKGCFEISNYNNYGIGKYLLIIIFVIIISIVASCCNYYNGYC
ncbi:hypothetical protein [Clostridium sp. DL1XJH146]